MYLYHRNITVHVTSIASNLISYSWWMRAIHMYKYQSSGSYGLLCFSKSLVQKTLSLCVSPGLVNHGQNWLDYPKINSISTTFNLIIHKINSVQRIDLINLILTYNSPENWLDLLYCWSPSVRGKLLRHKLYNLPFAQVISHTNTSEERVTNICGKLYSIHLIEDPWYLAILRRHTRWGT